MAGGLPATLTTCQRVGKDNISFLFVTVDRHRRMMKNLKTESLLHSPTLLNEHFLSYETFILFPLKVF